MFLWFCDFFVDFVAFLIFFVDFVAFLIFFAYGQGRFLWLYGVVFDSWFL